MYFIFLILVLFYIRYQERLYCCDPTIDVCARSELCPQDKVTSLPKYTEEAEEVPVVETRSYCDCVGCEGQKALCYCIDCGRRLCKLHNEVCPVIIIIM